MTWEAFKFWKPVVRWWRQHQARQAKEREIETKFLATLEEATQHRGNLQQATRMLRADRERRAHSVRPKMASQE